MRQLLFLGIAFVMFAPSVASAYPIRLVEDERSVSAVLRHVFTGDGQASEQTSTADHLAVSASFRGGSAAATLDGTTLNLHHFARRGVVAPVQDADVAAQAALGELMAFTLDTAHRYPLTFSFASVSARAFLDLANDYGV